jgi:hypothetical protein
MRRLTKNVGASQFDQNIDLTKVKFNKILICRPNPRLKPIINHSPITRGHYHFSRMRNRFIRKWRLSPIIFKKLYKRKPNNSTKKALLKS